MVIWLGFKGTQQQMSCEIIRLEIVFYGNLAKFFGITFMYLADAFIQSDLHFYILFRLYIFFCQYMCSLGIEPTTFALLTQCSNH